VKRRDCPRRLQRSFGDGLIAAEIKDLHEAWMPQADVILVDNEIVHAVHRALARCRPESLRRGRPGFPAEVVLRLLILKHLRNWSSQDLERKVRANLVYRDFTRIGSEKVPDAKTVTPQRPPARAAISTVIDHGPLGDGSGTLGRPGDSRSDRLSRDLAAVGPAWPLRARKPNGRRAAAGGRFFHGVV
jgi:hypothetical protein